MPWYSLRIFSTSPTVRARSTSKKWFRTRPKFSAFTSRMAKAVVSVHGRGTPTRSVNTGPYRVHHSVLVTVWRDPSGWRAWTETGRGSMATGCPSRRYDVGSPGTSVSWYGVDREAGETGWVPATGAGWAAVVPPGGGGEASAIPGITTS